MQVGGLLYSKNLEAEPNKIFQKNHSLFKKINMTHKKIFTYKIAFTILLSFSSINQVIAESNIYDLIANSSTLVKKLKSPVDSGTYLTEECNISFDITNKKTENLISPIIRGKEHHANSNKSWAWWESDKLKEITKGGSWSKPNEYTEKELDSLLSQFTFLKKRMVYHHR